MKFGDLYPIVLCDGSEPRHWLFSRTSYLKRLLKLVPDNYSFIQNTLLRLSKLPGTLEPILVFDTNLRLLISEQSKAIKRQTNQLPALIYVKSMCRNTALAIALVTLYYAEETYVRTL